MALEAAIAHSRRAVLAAALGGLAAFVSGALGRVAPARAADGDPVLVGGEHTATSVTKISHTGTDETALWGEATQGTGVWGTSDDQAGVYGRSVSSSGVVGRSTSSSGVYGESQTSAGVVGAGSPAVAGQGSPGVLAQSINGSALLAFNNSNTDPAILAGTHGSTGLLAYSGFEPVVRPTSTGVYGYQIDSSAGRGVWGRANVGDGVYGQASTGRGVYGHATLGRGGSFEATRGIALHANGRVQLERASGTATISAGTKSKTVTPGFDLTSSTKVLVTLLGHPGGSTVVQRVFVNATNDNFTVHLTANATANTKVAWLVLV